MDFKKILKGSIIALGVGSLLVLAGCANTYNQSEVDDLLNKERLTAYDAGIAEGASSIDITADNEAVVADALAEYEVSFNQTTEVEDSPLVWLPSQTAREVCEDYVIDNLYLGSPLNQTIDDSDFCLLSEGSVDFNDEDFDFRETIELTDDLRIAYSGYPDFDKDFKGDVALVLDGTGVIRYTYQFEELPTWSEISYDESMDITFLGKELEVVNADPVENSITVVTGAKVILKKGQSYEGLTLVEVGDNEVLISYNGEPVSLDEGNVKVLDGARVRLEFTSNNEHGESLALIRVGDTTGKTYEDSDEYLSEDDEDPVWTWHIDLNAGTIGAWHDQRLDDPEDALNVGDSVDLPEQFARITFQQIKLEDTEDYTFDMQTIDVGNVSLNALVGEGDFEYNTDRDVRKIAWDGVKFYARDNGNWFEVASVAFEINKRVLTSSEGVLSFDGVDLSADFVTKKLTFLTYEGQDLSTRDETVLTREGYSILGPEDNFEDGTLELRGVPEDEHEYGLRVSGITVEE